MEEERRSESVENKIDELTKDLRKDKEENSLIKKKNIWLKPELSNK